jgi:hypothetical protein
MKRTGHNPPRAHSAGWWVPYLTSLSGKRVGKKIENKIGDNLHITYMYSLRGRQTLQKISRDVHVWPQTTTETADETASKYE